MLLRWLLLRQRCARWGYLRRAQRIGRDGGFRLRSISLRGEQAAPSAGWPMLGIGSGATAVRVEEERARVDATSFDETDACVVVGDKVGEDVEVRCLPTVCVLGRLHSVRMECHV